MYAAAGGASIAAGRKARQTGRQHAPDSPPHTTSVRAYSCQHWESRLLVPPVPPPPPPPPPPPRPLSTSCVHGRQPCDADVAECAEGRAAWQEAAAASVGGGGGAAGGAARRCSVLGDHPGARKDNKGKWPKNNRVRDASHGSSSDSENEGYGPNDTWGVARLLYAGLGTLAIGLVVYFVGTGDKGFKTPALRLVGPSLIFAGLGCVLLRIAFCIFAKPCCQRRNNFKENRRRLGAEGEEMPLARGPRVGPAQCSPARRLDTSSCDVSSLSSGEEDERLRRYRRAEPVATFPPRTTLSAPALQGTTVEQILVQPKPEKATVLVEPVPVSPVPSPSPVPVPSPAPARRPPPRTVSFAGPADGEIVLSVSQLRS